MELSTKVFEQIAFNPRAKIEEHMLNSMDESAHEESSSQFLQTENKQNKLATVFLTGYKSIFKVTNRNNKFFLASIPDDENTRESSIPPRPFALKCLKEEAKRNIIEEGCFYRRKLSVFKDANDLNIKESYRNNTRERFTTWVCSK